MKNILTRLARQFRIFAAGPSGNTESVPSPEPSAFAGKNHAIAPFPGTAPTPLTAITPNASRPPNSLRTGPARPKPNELQNANSFNSDFITREELKRELDLVRRLIESRK